MSELDTAMRWLLGYHSLDPGDIDHPPSQPSRSAQPIRSRWILTKGHERALAPFTLWCEARLSELRHSQFHRRLNEDPRPRPMSELLPNEFRWRFQGQTNPRSDSGKFFEDLKADLAREGYSCPESVLHVFAQGVVSEAYRIRDEAASGLKGRHSD